MVCRSASVCLTMKTATLWLCIVYFHLIERVNSTHLPVFSPAPNMSNSINMPDLTNMPKLTKMPDLQSMGSCKNRCGQAMGGCTCTVRCLVYSNCCEDFFDECPDLVNGTVSQSEPPPSSRCVKEKILVITECPAPKNTSEYIHTDISTALQNQFSIFQETSSSASDPVSQMCWTKAMEHQAQVQQRSSEISGGPVSSSVTTSTQGQDTEELVLTAMTKALVTDRSTGIVYDNIRVFLCHVTPQSVPCMWGLSVDDRNMDQPDQIYGNDLDIYYSPPTTVVDFNTLAFCVQDVISGCDETSKFYSKHVSDMCQAFHSPVQTFGHAEIYKNRYCLACMKGLLAVQTDNIRFINPLSKASPITNRYSILVRLKGDSLILKHTHPEQRVDEWQSATCGVKKADTLCKVTSCGQGAKKQPDGKCKKMYLLHMAIHDTTSLKTGHTYHEINFAPKMHRKLAKLLYCLAKKHVDLDLETDTRLVWQTTYRVFPNLTMYGVTIPFYDVNFYSHYDIVENFSRTFGNPLAQILNNDVEVPKTRLKGTRSVRIQDVTIDANSTITGDSSSMMVTWKAPMTQQSVSPFCSCTSDYIDINSCTLMCFFRKDNQKEWDKKVDSVKGDSCVMDYLTDSVAAAPVHDGLGLLAVFAGVASYWTAPRL